MMKRARIVMALGFAGLIMAASVTAQGPGGRGLSALVCIAEQGASLPAGSQVNVVIVSDTGPVQDGIGQATVTINHGRSSSTHVVVYYDADDSGHLSCGDAVLSVV